MRSPVTFTLRTCSPVRKTTCSSWTSISGKSFWTCTQTWDGTYVDRQIATNMKFQKRSIYIYNMPENSQNCSLATSTWARSLELASANDLVGAGGSKNCTENKAAARTRPATGMCWPFPNNGCGFESARMLNTWDGKLRKALRSHKSHEQGHEQGHARFTTLRV